MSRRRHRLAAVAAVAVTAAVLAGCSSNKSKGSNEPSASPTQPLTGLPVSAGGDELHRPAVFVKIENSSAAQPQSGLEKADVVYEAVAEGGITRFAAIYQSQDPGEVGPVRSVRPQDPDIAGPLNGLAAFSGGLSAFVEPLDAVAQDLSSDKIGEGPPYVRITTRQAPHNLYVNVGGLWPKADDNHQAPPPPLFSYGPLPASTQPASAVTVRMSPVVTLTWTWDGSAWRRSQDGTPFTVTGTGRIGPQNVLVQFVTISTTSYVDPNGTPVPSSQLIGSGQAELFRNGKVITGTWTKTDVTTPTTFTSADGTTMTLQPGQTWVELAPAGTPTSISR
jgi:hypothetical protein